MLVCGAGGCSRVQQQRLYCCLCSVEFDMNNPSAFHVLTSIILHDCIAAATFSPSNQNPIQRLVCIGTPISGPRLSHYSAESSPIQRQHMYYCIDCLCTAFHTCSLEGKAKCSERSSCCRYAPSPAHVSSLEKRNPALQAPLAGAEASRTNHSVVNSLAQRRQ